MTNQIFAVLLFLSAVAGLSALTCFVALAIANRKKPSAPVEPRFQSSYYPKREQNAEPDGTGGRTQSGPLRQHQAIFSS